MTNGQIRIALAADDWTRVVASVRASARLLESGSLAEDYARILAAIDHGIGSSFRAE